MMGSGVLPRTGIPLAFLFKEVRNEKAGGRCPIPFLFAFPEENLQWKQATGDGNGKYFSQW